MQQCLNGIVLDLTFSMSVLSHGNSPYLSMVIKREDNTASSIKIKGPASLSGTLFHFFIAGALFQRFQNRAIIAGMCASAAGITKAL
ncbi:hypothetical protein D3C81_1292800 [compost metagenome]